MSTTNHYVDSDQFNVCRDYLLSQTHTRTLSFLLRGDSTMPPGSRPQSSPVQSGIRHLVPSPLFCAITIIIVVVVSISEDVFLPDEPRIFFSFFFYYFIVREPPKCQ